MNQIQYCITFLCLLISVVLFYESFTWSNPSAAMLRGNYLTEYFVMLTTAVTSIDIQHAPKHDFRISFVNIVSALIFLLAGVALFLKVRKS